MAMGQLRGNRALRGRASSRSAPPGYLVSVDGTETERSRSVMYDRSGGTISPEATPRGT
ncbi:MAG: hypothetical protein ACRDQZ_02410 [Mycobacteriales bacterium]